MTIRFGSSSLINGSDETLGCESFLLSYVSSINDRAFKIFYVLREEEALPDHFRSIVNGLLRCCHESIEVNQAYLISSVINFLMC